MGLEARDALRRVVVEDAEVEVICEQLQRAGLAAALETRDLPDPQTNQFFLAMKRAHRTGTSVGVNVLSRACRTAGSAAATKGEVRTHSCLGVPDEDFARVKACEDPWLGGVKVDALYALCGSKREQCRAG